jgi:flagellar protein FliO/FliZ
MRNHAVPSLLRRACISLGGSLLMIYGTFIQAAETATETVVPSLTGEPLAGGSLARMGLGLFAVVFLIVAMAWGMRRMGGVPGTSAGALRVLGGLSMGTRERVVLIQVGDTQLLLGVAPGRVETLYVLDEPIAQSDAAKPGMSNFAANLTAALNRSKKS